MAQRAIVMSDALARQEHVEQLGLVIRKINWDAQKQLIHTLSRPEIGLTVPQMVTLFAIYTATTCRMSELAEATQQSAGTLTGIVDRLIDDGLVERVRDEVDRRVVHVALTAQGIERLARVEAARHEDMKCMFMHFKDEQLVQMKELLHLFLEGIHNAYTIESDVAD